MLSLVTNHPRQIRLAVALAVVLFAAMSLPVLAQAPPSGDTFVSSSFAKSNFGSSFALAVQPGATTFIQFNLSGVPAGASVTKATLRLYVDAVGKSGSFDVFQVNSSWNENTLTFSTAPVLGTSATGGHPVSITSASYNQFLLIDITALVQGWLNGSITNNGVALALTSGSQGSFSFDSKESLLTGNGPELEIALAGAVGPQGPQGIQGPAGQQGAQGPAGPKGDTGATGSQGPKGDTGATGPQGLKGDTGATGPMGPAGPQGSQGDPGAAGKDGVGFNFRNAFDNSASYAVNDVASYNGSSYVAKSATNPGDPTPDVNPNWSLMAQQGATGPVGAPGQQGPAGPIGPMGPQGPQGTPPPNVAVTDATNIFNASQTVNGNHTVNGNLVLGAGGAIQFADGTTQSSAATGGGGVIPTGYMIVGSSPTPPSGYSLSGSFIGGNSWATIAPLEFARAFLAGASLNGKVYTIGGVDAGSFLFPGAEGLDPGANTWSFAFGLNAERLGLAAATANGSIYMIGGQGDGGITDVVEQFNPSTGTSTVAPMLTARTALAAATANGLIYAIGGESASNSFLNVVEAYDPVSNVWTSFQLVNRRFISLTPMPTARRDFGAATVNGKIYAIGGYANGALGTVEVYDPSSNSWTTVKPMPTPRYALAVATVNGKIYAIGGTSFFGALNTVEVYDPSNDAWSTAPPLQVARKYHAASDANGLIFVSGGLDGGGNVLGSVEAYTPPVTLYTYIKN